MFGILTWPSVCHGAEYHRDGWARFLREEDEHVVNTFAKQVPNWCSLHPCPYSSVGYQLNSAECMDIRLKRVVPDHYCHYYPENVKPKPKLKECSMDPCPSRLVALPTRSKEVGRLRLGHSGSIKVMCFRFMTFEHVPVAGHIYNQLIGTKTCLLIWFLGLALSFHGIMYLSIRSL